LKEFKVKYGNQIDQLYAPIIKCSQKDYAGAVSELQKNYKVAEKNDNFEGIAMMNLNIVMRAKPQFKENGKLISSLKDLIDSRYDFYSKDKTNMRNVQMANTYKFFQNWMKK
jgi:hypothetical protein